MKFQIKINLIFELKLEYFESFILELFIFTPLILSWNRFTQFFLPKLHQEYFYFG